MVDVRYIPKYYISSGAYGVVCACLDSVTNKMVAIKKVYNAFNSGYNCITILREVRILQHLQGHPSVVRLLDIIEPRISDLFWSVYLVFDYASHNLLAWNNRVDIDCSAKYELFVYQMLLALKYMHSAGILHRDLKPENVLVNSAHSGTCINVCDFGQARPSIVGSGDGDGLFTEGVTTLRYRAPEVLCTTGEYGPELDIWSLGCIVAGLYHKNKVLFGMRQSELGQLNEIIHVLGKPTEDDLKWISQPNQIAFDHIRRLPASPAKDWTRVLRGAPLSALDLISKMVVFNPSKRISVDEALEHPYLECVRDKRLEVNCNTPFDNAFECEFTNFIEVQDIIWTEILKFRPGAKPKYNEWWLRVVPVWYVVQRISSCLC